MNRKQELASYWAVSFIWTMVFCMVAFLLGGAGAALACFACCMAFDAVVSSYAYWDAYKQLGMDTYEQITALLKKSRVASRDANVVYVDF